MSVFIRKRIDNAHIGGVGNLFEKYLYLFLSSSSTKLFVVKTLTQPCSKCKHNNFNPDMDVSFKDSVIATEDGMTGTIYLCPYCIKCGRAIRTRTVNDENVAQFLTKNNTSSIFPYENVEKENEDNSRVYSEPEYTIASDENEYDK